MSADSPAPDEGAPNTPADVLDVATATDEQLVEWIKDGKPTVDEVVAAAGGEPEHARRLLAAERSATSEPRKGVVKGLDAVISPPASAEKVPALLLTLGGAPLEWHTIEGVGYAHPRTPSPVGGEGELSLERAYEADERQGCPVALIEISVDEAVEARAARSAARKGGLAAARDRRSARDADKADVERVNDEAAAVAGKGR